MRQSKSLANAEIIVSPPKMTNKVSVSEELYEHIRETCACIDDAMSSETLVDITDYLEMADKSAQAAFDMLEKHKEQKPIAHENNCVSKPKTSLEILKHYLVWAENSEEDCPYTWKELAAAIKDAISALEQKPAEWNEEDEKRIQSILFSIGYCKEEYPNKKDYSKDINWLKSLRPQPHWKPSKEQMEVFVDSIYFLEQKGFKDPNGMIESLYQDLKKL